MSERLPNCDCPACRRAVAILAQPVTAWIEAEAEAMRAAYESDRARHRIAVPPKTREECEAGDGHQLELVLPAVMPPASD
jgi:hypothetical protein